MKVEQLKNLSLSLLVVLSLFASSWAACCCSEEVEKAVTKTFSCHQTPHDKNDFSGAENTIAVDDCCRCKGEISPKVFTKSDNVKLKKQPPEIVFSVDISFEIATSHVATENFAFAKPFYLSDSFYNLKSPRAPPFVQNKI